MTLDDVRGVVGGLDYPMLIVTAAAGDERDGCLVGFATQCSIRPLRFLVCLSKRNATYRIAQEATVLAVHFLAEDDRAMAELFGGLTADTADKLSRCAWHPGPEGVPLLDDVAGHYVGHVIERLDVGDHVAFLLDPVDGARGPSRGRQLGFQDVKDIEPGHEA